MTTVTEVRTYYRHLTDAPRFAAGLLGSPLPLTVEFTDNEPDERECFDPSLVCRSVALKVLGTHAEVRAVYGPASDKQRQPCRIL